MTQADFPNNDGKASPLVSLIVRALNRPRFLQEALQSICTQSYPNIEIVVINDGGEDVSAVVNDFANRVSALQLIQLPQNIGRSGAANQGLSVAKGEFIGFLDDDTLDPDHIADLIQAIHQHPQIKAVYAGVRLKDETGQVKGNFNLPFDQKRLFASNFIPIHALLFSRSLIEEGRAQFDENMDVYEDWDFWLQLSFQTSFLHVNKISATYRVRGNSSVGLIASEDMQRQGREQLFDKWRLIWNSREINQLAQCALDLERKLTECDNRIAGLNQALAEYQNIYLGAQCPSPGLESGQTAGICLDHRAECLFIGRRNRRNSIDRHYTAPFLLDERYSYQRIAGSLVVEGRGYGLPLILYV
ncbi:MAG: glycosyltransferase family 2 protein [Methylobacter sp.]